MLVLKIIAVVLAAVGAVFIFGLLSLLVHILRKGVN